MNSMPEPSNHDDRINDNTDFRDGYAEGFLDAVTGKREPAGGRRDDCPEWCTLDHGEDDARDDLVLHLGDDHVDGTVRRLLEVHDGSKLAIQVARCDDLSTGTVGTPNLMVRADLELKTWEQVGELARTILDSFGYLEGADRA